MKKILTITLTVFCAVMLCKSQENMKLEFKTEKEKASYALGMQLGNNFQQQGFLTNLNFDYIIAGIKDQVNNQAQIDINETDQILTQFFTELQKVQSSGNIEEGEKFLAENAKRKEVVVTESGLQYEILVEGNGPKPNATSTVKTHYKGTLLDGTVFDSSYDRGEPLSFPLNQVIKAWTEALQLMPVGSKWKLYVPYYLGYGERGAGALIGPYATLIFEVELLDIEK
jgi:FKBP-type peptidyl-prolyl cis-trans isomerase FklB